MHKKKVFKRSLIIAGGIAILWGLSGAFLTNAATPWSGILSTSRAVDWSQAGAGTIPDRTTICATVSPGVSLATLNADIANCPANEVVYMNAGSYTFSGQIIFNNKSNVTLRGAGPDQTFVKFNAEGACNGLDADVCVINGDNDYGGNPSNVATWTSGYTPGSTSITLGSVTQGSISNLHVGSLLILDQLDDSADTGNIYTCQSTGSNGDCSQQGSYVGRPGRAENQQVTVTSITGSGPYTIGITPGIYAPNWKSSQSPGAWWSSSLPVTGDGIEDLTLNHQGANGSGVYGMGVQFVNAENSWMDNVRSLNDNNGVSQHVEFFQSSHITVQNSYFYGSNPSSEGYGVSCDFSSADNLVVNNVFNHVASPLISQSCIGSVYAYNYAVDDYFGPGNWQQGDDSHTVGDMYNLFEGNEDIMFTGDDIHGTSNMYTFFRNYYSGLDPATANGTKTQNTEAIFLLAYNRYYNMIGNVLGTAGYHQYYNTQASSATDCGNGNSSLSVFSLGYSDQNGTAYSAQCFASSFDIPNDLRVATTLMRWGNYDTVTGATRWCGDSSDPGWSTVCGSTSEVPSAISAYPNPVPASTALPSSFYLSSKPNWWPSSIPWPAIGPDVSGGNVASVGGHVYLNPAANCYLNIMGGKTDGTSGALTFNANNCYSSTASSGSSPAITSALTTSATQGSSFTYQIAASNNPTSYNASGLPSGLSVNTSSGLISGTPSTQGTYGVTISATNTSGTGTATLTITVGSSDTTPPSAPTNLTATALSNSSVSLAWSPSTDNVGVAGYYVYRGSKKIATVNSTSFTDTGLAASTTYTYGLIAYDGAGNLSAAASPATVTTLSAGSSWGYYQNTDNNSGKGTNALAFNSPTQAGDLIVAEVDWTGGGTFTSISDSAGDTFTLIGAEQNATNVGVKSRLYYAKNIKGGADTITTVVSGSPAYHELFISEYTGLSTSTPLDAYAVNQGSGASFTSGNLTTTSANDLLIGTEIDSSNGSAAAGWTSRSNLDGDVVADKNASTIGTYSFTGTSGGASLAWLAAFKLAGATSGGSGGDTVAPSTAITAPSNGSTVSGTLSVTASASDNVGVTRVELYVDGTLKATDTASPYAFSLDTTSLSNGTHTLQTKAYDAAGNVGTSGTVSVTVSNIAPPSITSMTTASATKNMSFTYQIIGTNSPTSYNASGLPSGLSVNTASGIISGTPSVTGTYQVTISATNQGGTGTATLTIGIAAAPDTTPPTISITAPSNGSTVSGTLSVTASASDNVGVTRVELYVDGTLKATDTASPYAFSLDTTSLSNGTHTLQTKAYDAAGNVGTSGTVSVTVSNAPQTLSVSLAATDASDTVPFGDSFTAQVGGTAAGTINYLFYCNRSDSGTNVTSPVDLTVNASNQTSYTASNLCTYSAPGTYVAKVIVERGTASPAQAQVDIVASASSPVSTSTFQVTGAMVTAVTNTSAALTITLSSPASIQVEYGSSISYGLITNASPVLTTVYENLTGLAPNTTYNFAVVATPQGSSSTVTSQNFTFTTNQANGGGGSPGGGGGGGGGSSGSGGGSPGGGGGVSGSHGGGGGGGGGGYTSPSTGTSPTSTSDSSSSNPVITYFPRLLQIGDSGSDVHLLQILLQALGFFPASFVPTQYFGPLTLHGILLFQGAHNLPLSGSLDSDSQVLLEKVAQATYGSGSTPSTPDQSQSSTSTYSYTRNLGPGAQGADVSALQTFLNQDGDYPEGLITGYYGALTTKAVQIYQAKQGIVTYGTPWTTGYGAVGPKTRARLNGN